MYVSVIKVDVQVMLIMEDRTLQTYFPFLGDRIAVRQFCREFTKRKGKNTNRDSSRKTELIERLREKLENAKKESISQVDSEDDFVTSKRTCFNDAKEAHASKGKDGRKQTKVIYVGWVRTTSCSSYSQVRQNKGGGTRSLKMPLSSTKADIIHEAKQLFFPDGWSPLGRDSEFCFDICDSNNQLMTVSLCKCCLTKHSPVDHLD